MENSIFNDGVHDLFPRDGGGGGDKREGEEIKVKI
jgi:hypothetical protein